MPNMWVAVDLQIQSIQNNFLLNNFYMHMWSISVASSDAVIPKTLVIYVHKQMLRLEYLKSFPFG